MTTPVVVYADPPWASGARDQDVRGEISVEQRVYGDRVDLRITSPTSHPTLLQLVPGCSALVVFRCQVTEELLNAAGSALRVVARYGVGIENLNAPLLLSRNIVALNVPDYCVDEVATHTLALALGLERRILTQHNTLRDGVFDSYAGGVPRRLNRCTAGIVGFGRIGRAVASRLRAFYGSLLVFDPYVGPDLAEGYGGTWADLPTLLSQSDLVTLHCPLTTETKGLIGRSELERMRPDALLINTARGSIVDAPALLEALRSNRIGGVGVDVFSPENPTTDSCWMQILQLSTVLATSHRAFLSRESELSVRERIAQGVLAVLNGKLPQVGVVEVGVGRV